MFQIFLKRANERRQEQIENRLNAAVITATASVIRDYGGDYTKWAVVELTDAEFAEIARISWE